jgi:hypothetical protein
MIKHACHFRGTLIVVLVFEAMVARAEFGVSAIHRLRYDQRQHNENLSHHLRRQLDSVNQKLRAQTKTRELLARAFYQFVAEFSD